MLLHRTPINSLVPELALNGILCSVGASSIWDECFCIFLPHKAPQWMKLRPWPWIHPVTKQKNGKRKKNRALRVKIRADRSSEPEPTATPKCPRKRCTDGHHEPRSKNGARRLTPVLRFGNKLEFLNNFFFLLI